MKKSKSLLSIAVAIIAFGFLFSCSEDVPEPTNPTGSVVTTLTGAVGTEVIITGTIEDAQGLASISIVNSALGINLSDNLSDATSFTLSVVIAIPCDAAPGDYTVVVSTTNNVELTATFDVVITVSELACLDRYSTFGATTVSGMASEGGYIYEPFAISFAATIADDMITLTGEYTNYHGNTLTVQAVPGCDPSAGTLVWTEELLGDDGYGAIYHAIPTEGTTSTYDACTGEMTIYYDYEWNYEAGAGWEYWYSAVLTIAVE